ncbi:MULTISPECIES: glycosyltransferase family 2 protein [Acinetobacter]|jgi:biofilm PGA synthesis N-glycosyltransferase PgaC|uniref:Biofilm PGA synthesis N-glycosyltransferase PgaC n=3 Tax=Acinetobacter tandoii TaxID=202954 RepID=R9ATC6_9GAMM|nr:MULTISPECIES: glycosyltransferase family 2 protein [Acinetobacter]EOR05443.1 biofilm PGA synthesis N-glycosyltransferase PgaC [Acinetobacter tandoii DSM 14970 = CIP 107469]
MISTDTDKEISLIYFSIRFKFCIALIGACLWTWFSIWIAQAWIHDLSTHIGMFAAIFLIYGIAIIPGFMNSFAALSLMMDKRPRREALPFYPGISILIAAYNEAASIKDTLVSISQQNYPGKLQVIVINDGSKDETANIVRNLQEQFSWLTFLDLEKNAGKAHALNEGFKLVEHDLVVTIDADSYLHRIALINIVERYLLDPPNTRAVAGKILVRNSRENLLTKTQEWDYFLGISATKRMQSLYQGTLVAQGAFSIYDRAALIEVGGWPECVGEDIVLTWSLLNAGYRVGHCEDACLFTNAPTTLRVFIKQRQRWARGMMEAFIKHPSILIKPRLSTFFIYWNLLFPWLDLAFTFGFLPGLVLACFGYYWIVGIMTLVLLPMALLLGLLNYFIERQMFDEMGLKVRKNFTGFLIYVFAYSFLLQPASILGYLDEILRTRKTWGTK